MQGKLAWHDVPQPVDNGGYPGNPSRVAVNDHPETAGNFSAVRHDADQAGILQANEQRQDTNAAGCMNHGMLDIDA